MEAFAPPLESGLGLRLVLTDGTELTKGETEETNKSRNLNITGALALFFLATFGSPFPALCGEAKDSLSYDEKQMSLPLYSLKLRTTGISPT